MRKFRIGLIWFFIVWCIMLLSFCTKSLEKSYLFKSKLWLNLKNKYFRKSNSVYWPASICASCVLFRFSLYFVLHIWNSLRMWMWVQSHKLTPSKHLAVQWQAHLSLFIGWLNLWWNTWTCALINLINELGWTWKGRGTESWFRSRLVLVLVPAQ